MGRTKKKKNFLSVGPNCTVGLLGAHTKQPADVEDEQWEEQKKQLLICRPQL
jgi:hypothetical protein